MTCYKKWKFWGGTGKGRVQKKKYAGLTVSASR